MNENTIVTKTATTSNNKNKNKDSNINTIRLNDPMKIESSINGGGDKDETNAVVIDTDIAATDADSLLLLLVSDEINMISKRNKIFATTTSKILSQSS
jgi:hypothetical protein